MDKSHLVKLFVAHFAAAIAALALAIGIAFVAPLQSAYATEPDYNLYKPVLQRAYNGTGEFYISESSGIVGSYFLFDMDDDDVAELIADNGWFSQYAYTISGGKVVQMTPANTSMFNQSDSLISENQIFYSYFSNGKTLYRRWGKNVTSTIVSMEKQGTMVKTALCFSSGDMGDYLDRPWGKSAQYLDSLGAKPVKRVKVNDYSLLPGWKKDSVGWWYRYANGGYPANKWEKIGGKWYHFDKSGYMQTGWQYISGDWYFLDNSSGAMLTGWQKYGTKWYFLDKKSGAMAWNEWREGYWLSRDGSWTYKYKGSWKQNSKGWWFGDTSGWYAKNGYQWINGKAYNFDKAGWCTNPY